MKHIAIIFVFLGFLSNAQVLKSSLNSRSEKQSKSIKNIDKPVQIKRWEEGRNRILLQQLQFENKEKQQEFKKLFDEYTENQQNIKKQFKPNSNFNALSDQEAKQQLDQSFQVGKELLENRKRYSDEFQKVIKPQQVLKIFHQEGKMRRKIMKRRDAIQPRRKR